MKPGKLKPGYLEKQLLVATPALTGSCFSKSVIYICVHNDEGAMGIILNQPLKNVAAPHIFEQLHIKASSADAIRLPVHFGGPVDPARGFVLHSPDYHQTDTVELEEYFSLTSNVAILRDIAKGQGPSKCVLALGYAGWEAGQLEAEVEQNSWISVAPAETILFDVDNDSKWTRAAALLGFDILQLSGNAGHA